MSQSWFAVVRSALLYATLMLLSTRKIFIHFFLPQILWTR